MGTLPAALEGSLDVFIPALASQGKADPTKDYLGVSGRRVVVPEKGWYSKGFPVSTHNIMKLLIAEMALVLR
jgi:hypothetical protein